MVAIDIEVRPEQNAGDGNDSESSGSSAIVPKLRPKAGSARQLGREQLNSDDFRSSLRRSQSAFLRSKNEVVAMPQKERVKVQIKNFFKRVRKSAISDDSIDAPADLEKADVDFPVKSSSPQYRLETTTKRSVLCCFRGAVTAAELSDIKPNKQLASFLHWMFRSNFFILFCVMCLCFFGLIVFFACFIIAASEMNEDCVRAGGDPGKTFGDAFTLSWTTFSTVGYGSLYPALSHENDSPDNCIFITFICSMESFVGVLYSGFCGAILFGKVLRIQSHAQVIFSDAIVIRYGSGLQEKHDDDHSHDDDIGEDGSEEKKIPCPVLEFRIVNRLFDEPGGEIMDASLNVVANINARDADPVLVDALNSSQRSKKLRRYTYRSDDFYGSNSYGHRHLNTSDSLMSDTMSEGSGRLSLDSRRSKKSISFVSSLISRNHRTVDEDPSSRLVGKRIFSKMYFEQCEHPFFKRVWVGRHILNGESPLVRPRVKRLIRKNDGFWPEKLNDYTSVRRSLLFNQILVSLNGVSNLNAHEVYAQKIYDFVDMNVGYQFVNTLYKDVDGRLKVDTDLINDVREQYGGGGEPLILEEKS